MRRLQGFTLIELLVTVAIVAVLASIALPLAEVSVQRNKEQELRRSLREIREAIDAYKQATEEAPPRITKPADQSGYPPTLNALVEGVTDARSPKGAKLYFLRRIPRDPFFNDPDTAPERTWGLRSYSSPPDNPRYESDVFDVYSLSPGVGLNGIPHREW